jgi:hypothetical protein
MQTFHDHNDTYSAVVSDLVSLIEHVQNGLRLIERMIAGKLRTKALRVPPTSSCSTMFLRDT